MPTTKERIAEVQAMPPAARLDALAEFRRQAQEGAAELAANLEGLDAAVAPAQHRQHTEALPRAQAAVTEIDRAIERTKREIADGHSAALRQPMSDSDRKRLDLAQRFLAACGNAERAAEECAAALRQARDLGEELARRCGNDRLFQLGYFRERATAGLVRKFEYEPAATGTWGRERALLELGPAKNRHDIARGGLLEYERKGLIDLLPPHVGAAL